MSQTGGHLGASLGVVELTVALHRVFDCPEDKIIFDVGHQAYPHKILTNRRDRMDTIRQSGGLSGTATTGFGGPQYLTLTPLFDLDSIQTWLIAVQMRLAMVAWVCACRPGHLLGANRFDGQIEQHHALLRSRRASSQVGGSMNIALKPLYCGNKYM